MKKITAGFVGGVLSVFLVSDISWYLSEKFESQTVFESVRISLISPNLGITEVLTKRCTLYKRGDITGREYFQCNKVQIIFSDLIWGK